MMNIIYASDDNYAPLLTVAMTSVCENNNVPIKFFILDNEIKPKNKSFLKNLEEKYDNVKIIFIELSDLEDRLNLPKFQTEGILSMNITAYSRLFMSLLLPEDIDKVLYLDCDTLVLKSLEELWDINIENFMCAGVEDPAPIALKETIGFKAEDTYINSGVLLINLKKWRENNIVDDFLKFLKEYEGKAFHHDQGIINGVLKGQILKIHPKFNLLGHFDGKKDINTVLKWNGCSYYYDKDTLIEAEQNTVIRHAKVWEFAEEYEKYIEISDVKERQIFSKTRNNTLFGEIYTNMIYSKIGGLLLKIVPSFIAIRIKNFVVRSQLKKLDNS